MEAMAYNLSTKYKKEESPDIETGVRLLWTVHLSDVKSSMFDGGSGYHHQNPSTFLWKMDTSRLTFHTAFNVATSTL